MSIIHNPDQNCFIMHTNSGNAVVDYSWRGDTMLLVHAEVPSALRGTGSGGRLANGVFAEIEKMGVKARPTCPFLVRVAKADPHWRKLFDL